MLESHAVATLIHVYLGHSSPFSSDLDRREAIVLPDLPDAFDLPPYSSCFPWEHVEAFANQQRLYAESSTSTAVISQRHILMASGVVHALLATIDKLLSAMQVIPDYLLKGIMSKSSFSTCGLSEESDQIESRLSLTAHW